MSIEYTLSIIKPDATGRHITGAINALIEKAGFQIVAQKRMLLTTKMAEAFYAVHKERSFFQELVTSMCAGPVVVQVLKRENAVAHYREIMGATNPAQAAAGTIRKEFGLNVGENSVHGSDSTDNAKQEIAFFFSQCEIVE